MTFAAAVTAVSDYVADRLPVEKMHFRSMVVEKRVPLHRMSWAYYLGGLSLFFLTVQVATGLMLLFYYEPTVSDAHASVDYITQYVSSGALIRNMHAWSASAMIFCVVAHMLTALAMKAFEKPREIIWVTGVFMLFLTFMFGFTGYLLPWNQIAVNATKVGLQSIEQAGTYLPGSLANIPRTIRETIQGEPSVGQATLSRFYAVHVVVLPLLVFGLAALHLFSIQLHGLSKGIDGVAKRVERFFPSFMVKDMTLWGVVFMILFITALCLPFESFFAFPLAQPYNPLGSTPEGIKPEWYFYFVYYPLEMLPFWIVMLAVNGGALALLATPWVFKGTSRRTLRAIAIAVGTFLIVITLFGQSITDAVKGVKP